ncbi:MAG: hypothetical protein AAGC69_21425, partial [Paracraurococcus sp.]
MAAATVAVPWGAAVRRHARAGSWPPNRTGSLACACRIGERVPGWTGASRLRDAIAGDEGAMTGAMRLGRVGLAGLAVTATAGLAWLLTTNVLPGFQTTEGPKPRPMPVTFRADAATAAASLPPRVEAAPVPAATAPRFHVARLGARGMLVTAGSAPAGAVVLLLDGERELGRTRADARGEW